MNEITAQQRAALDAETQRRISLALRQIEAAQGLIGDATATLSALQFAAPEWRSTSRLCDRVRAHWYRVRNALELSAKAKKVRLDPMAAAKVLASLRSGVPS